MFPGLAYQNQDLLGNVAWVPVAGVSGRLGSLPYTKKNGDSAIARFGVIPWLARTWFKYLSQFVGFFHKVSECGFQVFVEDFEFAITLDGKELKNSVNAKLL